MAGETRQEQWTDASTFQQQTLQCKSCVADSEILSGIGAILTGDMRRKGPETKRGREAIELDSKMDALSQQQSALATTARSADEKEHETARLEEKYQQLRQQRDSLMNRYQASGTGPALREVRDDHQPSPQQNRHSFATTPSRLLGESTKISDGDKKSLQTRLQKWWASRTYTWL